MDTIIKRLLLLFAVFAIAVSCSYESPTITHSTRIEIKIDPNSIKGTQAYITITPEDDRVYYTYDVISFDEYDEGIRNYGSEEAKINAALKEMYDNYASDWREYYGDQAYIASFRNSQLNYGATNHLAVNLAPETDYYALAFCIKCINDSTFRVNGEIFKEKFRTTEVQYTMSKMRLEYMLRDYDGRMYCYTKPTYIDFDILHDGKICREPYIMDIISESDLKEKFDGNLFKFAYSYYKNISESGHLSDFLKTDISRNEYNFSNDDEGKSFYIVGAPFNITYLNMLYISKFQYKRNMSTKYSSVRHVVEDLR